MKIIDHHGREIETDTSKRIAQLEEQVAELSRAFTMLTAVHNGLAEFAQRQLTFNASIQAAFNGESETVQ